MVSRSLLIILMSLVSIAFIITTMNTICLGITKPHPGKEIPMSVIADPPLPRTKIPLWQSVGQVERKFNILFLYDYKHLETIMDRSFFQIFEAAKKHKNIGIVEMYGRDWPGWDNSYGGTRGEQLADNIKIKYPDIKWDVLFTEPDRQHPLPELTLQVAPINTIFYHELYCESGFGRCMAPYLLGFANVVLFAYANSIPIVMHHVTDGTKFVKKLFYHVPHGAPEKLFFQDVDAVRDIGILLVGQVNALYPLRMKFHRLITENKIPHAVIRIHPGYHNLGKEENKAGWNISGAAEKQERDYAEQLKRTKILLVSRSIRQYAVRKYVEGALAGCLLVGNIPAERQDEFRQYMVEVDDTDPDEYIIQQLKWWLEHEEERKNYARIGQEIALQKYTYHKWVDQMVSAWQGYLNGQRGVVFPYQYTVNGTLTL